jgi:DNA invertase Pin-like site-specific DNA recombinase
LKRTIEAPNTMEPMDCIAYYRVSTQRQGESGLGLGAQKEAVERYVAAQHQRRLIAEFTEIESGRNSKRPEIHKAIAMGQARNARLVIAKLDRLARDVHFVTGLKKSGVAFVACDLPDANTLTINILAAVAQDEAERISTRIREALAVAKKRLAKKGLTLGGLRYLRSKKTGKPTKKLWDLGSVQPLAVAARQRNVAERNAPLIKTVKALRHDGLTLVEIGAELVNLGHKPPRNGQWHAAQVARLLGPKPTKKKRVR